MWDSFACCFNLVCESRMLGNSRSKTNDWPACSVLVGSVPLSRFGPRGVYTLDRRQVATSFRTSLAASCEITLRYVTPTSWLSTPNACRAVEDVDTYTSQHYQ